VAHPHKYNACRQLSNNRPKLTQGRYTLFLTVTLLVPLLVLGAVEGIVRVARPHGGLPLFVAAQFVNGRYLVANPAVGARWFAGMRNAPAPAPEPFAARKPDRAFRVFVLGESAAAGFPYPRNVTFSRLLRDVLRDVLPGDSVEVMNLGIAATNSFAMLDIAKEVEDQHPDAVLIYAAHNEYYGALGAASRVSIPGGAGVVRLYLRLLRLRSVLALRNALAKIRTRARPTDDNLEAASLMEVLARDRLVSLGSTQYERGVKQFEANLGAIVRVFKRHGTPVFIASVASNLRDQAPFAADANSAPNGANSAFQAARADLARADTAAARELFARARDLDVVRFRAPGEFNQIIRRVSERTGATYVPVAEAFAAASPGGIPGSTLFLEHVHPNRQGQALIGRVFFETILRTGLLRGAVDTSRLRPWDEYARATMLTPFDERIAYHITRTLTLRWPFVPVAQQIDYRGTYVPIDLLDSLAFAVSRGARWEIGKLQLAADYERKRQYDSAATEYAGLVRDAQLLEEPLRLEARALGLGGHEDEAEAMLRRAVAINPSAPALAALGTRAAQRREIPEAISLFQQSLALQPYQPDVLYKLSLAYGLSRDLPNARGAAMRLAQIAPGYPGLAELLSTLGIRQ
jgi:tetratricopeptide (TPR) repeat protein